MDETAAPMTRAEFRRAAILGSEETCPRCGARRSREQRYCLDCGLELPVVDTTVASLRRRWIRRLGWYPGDFVWTVLLALLVAAAGAAAAIVISERRSGTGTTGFEAATAAIPVRAPAAVPPARLRAPGSRPGRLTWPRNANGWTVVLVSYPKITGRLEALQTATQAAKARLAQVGILDSGRFASLQPGYFVVFAGIYGVEDRRRRRGRDGSRGGFPGGLQPADRPLAPVYQTENICNSSGDGVEWPRVAPVREAFHALNGAEARV